MGHHVLQKVVLETWIKVETVLSQIPRYTKTLVHRQFICGISNEYRFFSRTSLWNLLETSTFLNTILCKPSFPCSYSTIDCVFVNNFTAWWSVIRNISTSFPFSKSILKRNFSHHHLRFSLFYVIQTLRLLGTEYFRMSELSSDIQWVYQWVHCHDTKRTSESHGDLWSLVNKNLLNIHLFWTGHSSNFIFAKT